MPFIIEIIGLAGAGKSTLTHSLCQQNKEIVLDDSLMIRNVRHLPYIAKHTFLSLPTYLRQLRYGRRFTGRELMKIAYLNGWHQVLAQQKSPEHGVTILDQGPIYELATFYGFGPEQLHRPHFQTWWTNMFKQWGNTVDLVIWLDAPEEILIDRIKSRAKSHPVKESPEQEMLDFLAHYRTSHEYVMAEISAFHKLKILQFNTSSQTAEEIVAQVLNVISAELPSSSQPKSQPRFKAANHE